MRLTRTDAATRLRTLAVKAVQLDGGRIANRLSAYAVVILERSEQGAARLSAELDDLVEKTRDQRLADVVREARVVVQQALAS